MNDTVVIGGNQRLRNTVSGQANLRNVQSGAPNSSIRVVGSKFDETGTYPDLTAGNILSDNYEEDSVPYLFRQSGGGVRVGTKEEDTIVGGTIAWNQLSESNAVTSTMNGITCTNNGDGTFDISGTATANRNINFNSYTTPLKKGGIYLLIGCPSGGSASTYFFGVGGLVNDTGNGGVWKNTSNYATGSPTFVIKSGVTVNFTKVKPQMFDLTQMFGSTVADYIYALETATTGAGVAYFKSLFPKPYYAYNAGELVHVSGLTSHDTTGKNILPPPVDGTYTGNGITAVVSNGTITLTGTTTASGNAIIIPLSKPATVPPGAYVHLLNNVANGSVAPSFELTSDVSGTIASPSCNPINRIYQTTNATAVQWDRIRFYIGNNVATNVTLSPMLCLDDVASAFEPYHKNTYPLDSTLTLRGIPRVANNKMYFDGDTYASDGTVTRKYGIVDLGTLDWVLYSAGFGVSFDLINKTGRTNADLFPMLCANYQTVKYYSGGVYMGGIDKSIAYGPGSGSRLYIADSAYTDATAFKTAMSGVYLVYELATSTTETATGFTNPQAVDADGTEEYVITTSADVAVPVGHVTKYPTDMKQKLDGLPWDFSTLIAPTEKTFKATRAYTAKQFLIVNNQLYKVTASIANGANITVGTNVVATTIGEVLTSLL